MNLNLKRTKLLANSQASAAGRMRCGSAPPALSPTSKSARRKSSLLQRRYGYPEPVTVLDTRLQQLAASMPPVGQAPGGDMVERSPPCKRTWIARLGLRCLGAAT